MTSNYFSQFDGEPEQIEPAAPEPQASQSFEPPAEEDPKIRQYADIFEAGIKAEKHRAVYESFAREWEAHPAFNVDDPSTAVTAEQLAKKREEHFTDAVPGFRRGVGVSAKMLGSGIQQRFGNVGIATGLEQFGERQIQNAPDKRFPSVTDIKSIGDFGRWFAESAGEGVGSTVAPLAVGAAGALAGGPLAGIAATGATMNTMGVGQMRNALEDERDQFIRRAEVAKSTGNVAAQAYFEDEAAKLDPDKHGKLIEIAGGVIGALDMAGLAGSFMRNAPAEVAKKLRDESLRYVIAHISKRAGQGALAEGTTEAMQAMAEIIAVGRAKGVTAAMEHISDINEQRFRILDEFAAGAAGGTAFGIAGGAREAASARIGQYPPNPMMDQAKTGNPFEKFDAPEQATVVPAPAAPTETAPAAPQTLPAAVIASAASDAMAEAVAVPAIDPAAYAEDMVTQGRVPEGAKPADIDLALPEIDTKIEAATQQLQEAKDALAAVETETKDTTKVDELTAQVDGLKKLKADAEQARDQAREAAEEAKQNLIDSQPTPELQKLAEYVTSGGALSREERAGLAKSIGVDETAVAPILDQAVARGMLRKTKRGEYRRAVPTKPQGEKAVTAIGKTVADVARAMAPIMPRGTVVKSFSELAEIPANVRNELRQGDGVVRNITGEQVDAFVNPNDPGVIYLATYALGKEGRLSHEAVHALVAAGVLSPAEVKTLAARARKEGKFPKQLEARYREAYKGRARLDELINEEAAAHLIEARVNGQSFGKEINSAIDRVIQFIEKLANALRGQGFTTADDIADAILSGEVARRQAIQSFMEKEDITAVAVRPQREATPSRIAEKSTPEAAAAVDDFISSVDGLKSRLGVKTRQRDFNGPLYAMAQDAQVSATVSLKDAVAEIKRGSRIGVIMRYVDQFTADVDEITASVARAENVPLTGLDAPRLRKFVVAVEDLQQVISARVDAGYQLSDDAFEIGQNIELKLEDMMTRLSEVGADAEARFDNLQDYSDRLDERRDELLYERFGDDDDAIEAYADSLANTSPIRNEKTIGQLAPTPDDGVSVLDIASDDADLGSAIVAKYDSAVIAIVEKDPGAMSLAEVESVSDFVNDLVWQYRSAATYIAKTEAWVTETYSAFNPSKISDERIIPAVERLESSAEKLDEIVSAADDLLGEVVGDSTMFAFAGEKAKTADLNALDLAKRMELDGIDRDDIWTKTGWGRGVDGKWRFEIDDSQAEFLGGVKRARRFDKVLDHPAMAEAYPGLGASPVRGLRPTEELMGMLASYNTFTREFALRDAPEFDTNTKSSALHESQHYIQGDEGFGQGANEVAARGYLNDQSAAAQIAAHEAAIANKPSGLRYFSQKAWGDYYSTLSDLMAERLMARNAASEMPRSRQELLATYKKFAGEVEARTVQKRMDMTAAERRSRPMWYDYDVPEEQQIVRFGDGAQNSGPMYSLGDGDNVGLDAKLANFEAIRAAIDNAPREQRRPLMDGYDVEVWPSVGNVTYYVVERGKKLADKKGNISSVGRFVVKPAQRLNVLGVEVTNAGVSGGHQRKGIARAVYDMAERDFAELGGVSPSPRDQLSPDGKAFWEKRMPGVMFAMAQDTETGRSMRRDLDALGYYSGALEAAKGLKQAKGTPEQMLAQLKAGGAKQAELEATGLLKWIEEKSGSRGTDVAAGSGAVIDPAVVGPNGDRTSGTSGTADRLKQTSISKSEIIEFLEKNRVGVKEVSTGRSAKDADVTREANERIAAWEQDELAAAEFEYDRRFDDDAVFDKSDRWRAFADENGVKVDDDIFDDDPVEALTKAGMKFSSGTFGVWKDTDHFTFGQAPDGAVAVYNPNSGFEVLKGQTVDQYISDLTAEAERFIKSDILAADPYDRRGDIRREVETELNRTDPTKWSSYSLDPSNPTYRETVIHLPERVPSFDEYVAFETAKLQKTGQSSELSADDMQYLREAYDREEYLRSMDTTMGRLNFQSGHFSEPNIIGHMMTSMTKHEGKPVYTIDQIQSDWGQKLRDGGVRDEKKIAELKKQLADIKAKFPDLAKLKDASFDEVKKYPGALAAANDEARIAAELRTAEATSPGHPLVNTTDQWTNTTLRRALRQAAEADAEYVAIPSGKTVLSYNPGNEHGMEGFYNGIVPKNLRNLIQKLDKDAPAPTKIDKLETPTSGMKGNGFTVFKLTDAAKRAVLEEGQPLFAFANKDAPELPEIAALRFDGQVFTGRDHSAAISRAWAAANNDEIPEQGGDLEGYVTTKGRFVTRQEAAELLAKAGLPSYGIDGLHSSALRDLQASDKWPKGSGGAMFAMRQDAPELKSMQAIVQDLATDLGLTVRQGMRTSNIQSNNRRVVAKGAKFLKIEDGYYDPKTGVIRVASIGDIDAVATAAGDAIAHRFGAAMDALIDKARLRDDISGKPAEMPNGFSVWFKDYIINPALAEKNAPKLTDEFEALVDRLDPTLLVKIESTQDAIAAYFQADPTAFTETMVRGQKKATAWERFQADKEQFGTKGAMSIQFSSLYTTSMDSANPFALAVWEGLNVYQKNTGTKLDLGTPENPYKIARMGKHATAWAARAMEEGIRPYRGTNKPEGPGLIDALRQALGDDRATARDTGPGSVYRAFGSYLVAKYSVTEWERFRDGKKEAAPTRMPPGASTPDQAIAFYNGVVGAYEKKHQGFAEASEMVYDYQQKLLKYQRDSGLIKPETYDLLINDSTYVPMFRVFEDSEDLASSNTMEQGPGGVLKKKRGSERDVVDPIASIAQKTFETYAMVARNDIKRSLMTFAEKVGPGGGLIAERMDPTQLRAQNIDLDAAIKTAAKENGVDQADRAELLDLMHQMLGNDAIATYFTQKTIQPGREPIVFFFDGGEVQAMRLGNGGHGHKLARQMFDVLNTFGKDHLDLMTQIAAVPAQTIRMGVTTHPEFMIANIVRDALMAFQYDPKAMPLWTQTKGMIDVMRNAEYVRQYMAYGSMMGGEATSYAAKLRNERDIQALVDRGYKFKVFDSLPNMVDRLSELFEARNWMDRATGAAIGGIAGGSVAGPVGAVTGGITGALIGGKALTAVGEMSETATRARLWKHSYDRNIAAGLEPSIAAQEAAFWAHDYTDYSRRGSKMDSLAAVVPFLNANLQGNDVYIRRLLGKGDQGYNPGLLYPLYRLGMLDISNLSPKEQQELGLSAWTWAMTIFGLGTISAMVAFMWKDDERIKEIDDKVKASHWLIPVGKEIWRVPKPFQTVWFSQLIERIITERQAGNPRWFEHYMEDLWSTWSPPMTPAAAEVVAMSAGFDLRSGRQIIPFYMDRSGGRSVERQYDAYTSEFGKYMGREFGMSPMYVDHFIHKFGASWGRTFTQMNTPGLPWYDPNKPTKGPEEEFILRRFLWTVGRGSEAGQAMREIMGGENVMGILWGKIAAPYSKLAVAGNDYRFHIEKVIPDHAAGVEHLSKLTPAERGYAILDGHFRGSKDAKLRMVHPMNRAERITREVVKLQKEILSGEVTTGKKGKDQKLIPLSPSDKAAGRAILTQIQMMEAHNALVVTGEHGWKERMMFNTGAVLEELRMAVPSLAKEYETRSAKAGILPFAGVQRVWPELKARLESDATLDDVRKNRMGSLRGFVLGAHARAASGRAIAPGQPEAVLAP